MVANSRLIDTLSGGKVILSTLFSLPPKKLSTLKGKNLILLGSYEKADFRVYPS